MRYILTLVLFFQTCLLFSQTITISGTVQDSLSNEAIIGATIQLKDVKIGTQTDVNGYFVLSIPSQHQLLLVRAAGFEEKQLLIDSLPSFSLLIRMNPEGKQLESVEVNARRNENTQSTKMGQITLDVETLKRLPAFMGEVDPIKTIQLLPGVSSVNEGAQGFYVRGGGPDQNLVLLDDAMVYNAAHLFGFFSVFNSDAIKNVNLIKGGMPAQYGGRLSSVLEVNMKEGNSNKLKITGGIGLISSRLTVEGPLNKKKNASFLVSARRTYIDVFMKAFISDTSPFAGSSYYFYDLNAKLNYKIGKKDKLFFSAYYGKDKFSFGNKVDDFKVDNPWGNAVASLRWNHIYTEKLFVNSSVQFTDYQFSFGSQQDDFVITLKSGIRDIGSKVDFSFFPNNRNTVKWGVNYTYHTFTPTSVSAKQGDTNFDTGEAQKLFSHESGLYLSDEIEFTEKLKVNLGVRYSMYQFVGPFDRLVKGVGNEGDSIIKYKKSEVIQFYNALEPRIALRYLFKDNSSVKAGFMRNNQYIHLSSLSAVSLPTDIWYPSTEKAKPQQGYQASLGYFRNFRANRWETSVEVYYKDMKNAIEYKQGALPSDNVGDNPDNLLTFGTSTSYGIELFIKRTYGKLTGWIGYTLSKTDRYFPELQPEPFPAKYDRRHDLTLVGLYEISKQWVIGCSFIYASGNTLTLPTSWYIQQQDLLFNYGSRNSTRMAPYHRLDLSVNYYGKTTKKVIDQETGKEKEVPKRFLSNWNLSIYNVYNRANPYFLFVDNSGDLLKGDFKIAVKQVSLFPILPSITWNFEF